MTETPTEEAESGTEDEAEAEPQPESESDRERLIMEEVRHEPPNAGTSRTYERGHEGRDAGASSDGEEAADDE